MVLNLLDFPASPECCGKQWSVGDHDELATIVALVLVGRAKHAESVLTGTHRTATTVPNALKAQLSLQMQAPAGPLTYHRDGLLFEIISWIAARVSAAPDEVISRPHLKSTQQGLDTIKIRFDPVARGLKGVVIYEQKCSQNARDRFRDEVIPAFQEWNDHKRDNQLVQAVVALVERFNLSDDEHQRLYDHLVQVHPLSFQAALTVTPTPFDVSKCVALFSGYSGVTPEIADRMGDTFPLVDIRSWFSRFAQSVLDKIEASNV